MATRGKKDQSAVNFLKENSLSHRRTARVGASSMNRSRAVSVERRRPRLQPPGVSPGGAVYEEPRMRRGEDASP